MNRWSWNRLINRIWHFFFQSCINQPSFTFIKATYFKFDSLSVLWLLKETFPILLACPYWYCILQHTKFIKLVWIFIQIKLMKDRFHHLLHYQTPYFRLFQTEKVCRRQFQTWPKWQKAIQTGRKHCGKKRNCSLRAISPFPTVFSKGLLPRASKGVTVWEWVKYLSFF